mgnify:CR=1 FL=1
MEQQAVVAGRAVGAEGQIDACRNHVGAARHAACELEIRCRAVRDARAALGKQPDLRVVDVYRVHGDQSLGDEPESIEPRKWPQSGPRDRVGDFLRGLMHMHVHRKVEFLGQHGHPSEGGVADRVRRMRSNREAHQRIVAQGIPRRESLVQIVLGIRGIACRHLDGDDADDRAHPDAAQGARADLRVEEIGRASCRERV